MAAVGFRMPIVSQWLWLEHAGWVVFEDLFLIHSCIRGRREMRRMAERQAEVEDSRDKVEEKVRHRTAELQTLNTAFELSAAEARESEEKYRHTLNAAADAIICIDEQGMILEINKAAETLFEYQRAEVLGNPLGMLVPNRLREQQENGLGRYLTTGNQRLSTWQGIEQTGLTKCGNEIPLEISLSVLEAGGKKYLTGVLRDIRGRKQAEVERRISNPSWRTHRNWSRSATSRRGLLTKSIRRFSTWEITSTSCAMLLATFGNW